MRHLHPDTKEPQGPLWMGLVLLAAGLLGLLLLFSGCSSTTVSAGPRFASSGGLGYEDLSGGIEVVAERPGLRAEGHISTAQKLGSKKQGGAAARLLSGREGDRFGFWGGLRGAYQRQDSGDAAVWNPSVAMSFRLAEPLRLWLIYDLADSSQHETRAIVFRGEYELHRLTLMSSFEHVWFDNGRDGQAVALSLRWRW